MSDILVYALHNDDGEFNTNSLGAISEAAKLASETSGTASVAVVGEAGRKAVWTSAKQPPAKAAGQIIEDEDTNETVEKIVAWLDERKLL